MEPFTHNVKPGTSLCWGVDKLLATDVFVTIHWDGTELSLTGVEGPRANGNCRGGCGQICMHLSYGDLTPADGWTLQSIAQLWAVWDRWHLNHMRAGCAHQRAAHWDRRPIDPDQPLNAYGKFFDGQSSDSWNMLTWIRPSEHPDGLLTKECPTCGYRFGSAWQREVVPEAIITWLHDLPTSVGLPTQWHRR